MTSIRLQQWDRYRVPQNVFLLRKAFDVVNLQRCYYQDICSMCISTLTYDINKALSYKARLTTVRHLLKFHASTMQTIEMSKLK